MVKFCDKCGEEFKNDNAKFCDKCGAEVKITNTQSNAGTAPTGAMIICPHCAQPTPMGQTHCQNCGSTLENNTKAVIVGYILTFLIPIIGLIPAIYLLTRENPKVKTQGALLIGVIILYILFNLMQLGLITYIIIIILLIIGIILWSKDYSIF